MPDTAALGLPMEEIAARRGATRDAISSARIEGLEVSDEARALMELHDQGQISAGDMIARIHALHVGR